MPDKDAVRREVVSTLNDIARRYGFEAAESGKTARMRDFDTETGYWESPSSVTAKPPRWLLHLHVSADNVTASLPDIHGSKRTAYFNTANRDVGLGCFRIVPAIQFDGSDGFELHEDWDWLVWFAFSPPLEHGSSGQLLDEFDPATGSLTYLGRSQQYIAAGLVGLCDPASRAENGAISCTYAAATSALAALIHVEPMDLAASSTDESEQSGESDDA